MTYVADSMGWSERVRMENGAQNRYSPLINNLINAIRFLDRF